MMLSILPTKTQWRPGCETRLSSLIETSPRPTKRGQLERRKNCRESWSWVRRRWRSNRNLERWSPEWDKSKRIERSKAITIWIRDSIQNWITKSTKRFFSMSTRVGLKLRGEWKSKRELKSLNGCPMLFRSDTFTTRSSASTLRPNPRRNSLLKCVKIWVARSTRKFLNIACWLRVS